MHAGIPPFGSRIAYQYSQEIEDQLKNNSKELLENIWGSSKLMAGLLPGT